MMAAMMRTASLRRGLVLAVCGWMAAGCSLILDPANCADDGECNGGICQDGICVGGLTTPDAATDGQMADVGGPDMTPDGEPVDMEPVDQAVDMAPDMRDAEPPDPLAPSCTLVGDAPPDAPTTATEIVLVATVSDADTALAALTVTLDGEAITLDGGRFEGTRPLAEGANRFRLAVTDPDGQSCRAEVAVVADREAPVFEMLTPPPGADIGTRNPQFPVSGRVVDAHFAPDDGEGALEVTLGGVAMPDVVVAWNGPEFTFELPLAEGENVVALVAVDALGNRSAPVGFTARLDSTPPDVIVEAPIDGEEVFTDRVEVRAQVLEGGAPLVDAGYTLRVVDSAGRLVGGGEIMGLTGADGRVARTVPLVRGRNTVTVTGRDIAGNARSVVVVVTRRDALPCVAITAPVDGGFTAEPELVIEGDACPVVDRIELQVAGQPPVEVVPAGERFSGRIALPGPGQHRIEAVAFSAAGEAGDSITVIYDDSAPLVVVSEPLPNACTNARDLRVCGTVTDAQSGVGSVTLVAGDVQVAVALPPEGGPFCQTIAVAQGAPQQVTIRAQNRAGIMGSASVTVRVDRLAPVACITRDGQCINPVARPWFGANAAGRVVLPGRVDAGLCPVLSLTVNGTATAVDAQGLFEVQRVFADGVQQLDLVTRDVAGNEANAAFLFRVDTLPPALARVVPDLAYTRDAQVALSVTATDDGSGVVRVLIGGVEVFAAPAGVDAGQRMVDAARIVPLDEGQNSIAVEIFDLVGNRFASTLTIRRDTEAPQVAITSPTPDRPVPLPTTVTGTVDDGPDGSGAARITVNGIDAEIDAETGIWRADAVPIDPADPVLRVDAEDALGNGFAEPQVQAVTVRSFGAQAAGVDGLDFAGAVAWAGLLDVDRDGRLDVIALPAEAGGTAMVYTQGVDGRFLAAPAAAVGLPENLAVRHAAAGDFDADGRLDLFIVGSGRSVIALGNGLGGFRLVELPLAAVADPTDLIVGDLTRNGLLDAIVLAGANSRLLISNGDGSFEREPLANFGLAALQNHARAIAVDLNGDAVLDLVASGPGGSALWFGGMLNVFTTAAPAAGFFAEAGAVLLPLDADRDGALDVLVGGADGARFNLGEGNGAFGIDGLGGWPAAAVGAERIDFDGDARDDLIAWGGPMVSLWRASEDGFTAVDPVALGFDVGAVRTAAVGDVDGDGDDDVLVGGPAGLTFVRSNTSALDPAWQAVTIIPSRALAAGFGPADAHGVLLRVDLGGDDDGAPDRIIPARVTAPTVVTMGPMPVVGVTVVYIDLGGAGLNQRSLFGLLPGAREFSFAREGPN